MSIKVEVAADYAATTWTDITTWIDFKKPFFVGGEAHSGQVGTGSSFVVDDDAGTRAASLPGRRVVRVTETATTPDTILFHGRISPRTYNRGTRWYGDAKQIVVELDDYNVDLGGIDVQAWTRPLETDRARLLALITDFLSGADSNRSAARGSTDLTPTYVVASSTAQVHSTTYDDTNPESVVSDILGWDTKEFFITVDGEVFFDAADSTAYAAGLSITDEAPNLTDEFPPIPDGDAGDITPENFASGIRGTYEGGPESFFLADTDARDDHDKWEVNVSYPTAVLDKMKSWVRRDLSRQSLEEETYRCAIRLLKTQVDLIKYGQTLQFRWAAAGVTDDITVRVRRLLWEPVGFGSGVEVYIAHLELVKAAVGLGQPGGGPEPPGEPWVPCPPVTPTNTLGIRRYVKVLGGSTLHTFTWADAVDLDGNPDPGDPIPGNDLICAAAWRNPGETYRLGEIGFSIDVEAITQGDHLPLETDVAVGRRTVDALDTESQSWDGGSLVAWTHPISSQVSVIFELDAAAVLSTMSDSGPTQHGSLLTTGSSSNPAGGLKFGAARVGSADFSTAAIITPEAGVTTIGQFGPGPDAWIAYRAGSGGTDDISASAIFGDFLRDWHGGASAVYTLADPGDDEETPCPPPAPGQPVAPLELAISDCSQLDYQTPHPYAAHTLHVSIRNGAVLTPILFLETDPDTGAFRLLGSPCATVPSTTENVTIFDATADEWKFVFLSDGTPVTITIPGTTPSTLPSLVVEYIAGSTSGAPPDPPIVVEPPPAVPPVTVTDWYPGSPGVGSDQSAAIEAWIAATAGVGHVLGITPGIYRTDARIFNDTVDNLTLVATGVTFKRLDTSATGDPILSFWSCDSLAIFNLTVQGPASTSDVAGVTYPGTREGEHAFELVDCHGFTISHCNARNVWGDGLYYSRIGAGAASTLCEDGIIDTFFVETSGRNAISHISGRRIRIKDLVCSDLSLHGFDVEGNASDDVCEDITITGTVTSITDFGTGTGSHGVTGYAIQVGPGFGGNPPKRVLLESGSMDVAQINVQGPSLGLLAEDITFRNWSATSSGSSQVVHVLRWVNTGNDADFSLPASGTVT